MSVNNYHEWVLIIKSVKSKWTYVKRMVKASSDKKGQWGMFFVLFNKRVLPWWKSFKHSFFNNQNVFDIPGCVVLWFFLSNTFNLMIHSLLTNFFCHICYVFAELFLSNILLSNRFLSGSWLSNVSVDYFSF